MQYHINHIYIVHCRFLKCLCKIQNQYPVVDSIADIIIEFFSGEPGEDLFNCYAEFSSRSKKAQENFKGKEGKIHNLKEWHEYKQRQCSTVRRQDLPACIQNIALRLTKMPVLLYNMQKASDGDEKKKLNEALELVKSILDRINSEVAKKELIDQRTEIFGKLSPTSSGQFNGKEFKKADIFDRDLM